MMPNTHDTTLPRDAAQWMQKAIDIAKNGAPTTTPNPRVGCIILNEHGDYLTQAFHRKAGEPHAEALALSYIGDAAKNGIAYVTLEPCSHTGRTPPCADALIRAGVSTVVVAMRDPDPRVSGQGIARLRAAGITVHENIGTEAAALLNPGFLSRVIRKRPWIRLKAALSLDGKLALANGASQWITDETARNDVHQWRSHACAVLTGSGTVRHDNPQMTTRLSPPVERQPVRIVLDTRGQLHAEHTIWNTQHAPTIRCVGEHATPIALPEGVTTHRLPVTVEGKLSLEALWDYCYQQQLHEIHLEAGGTLLTQLLREQWVDECLLYMAPVFLGNDSRGLIHDLGLTDLTQATSFTWHDITPVGNAMRARLFKETPYQMWKNWQDKHATI